MERDRLYLLLDLLAGGPVGPGTKTIPPLPLRQVRRCLRDVVRGLEYLHYHNVVHRDIKPANIMRTTARDDCRYLIGDFGVSILFDEDEGDETTGNYGTLLFKPPEAHNAAGGRYSGKRGDIWSLGVTLYQLVYGQLPFSGDGVLEVAESVCGDALRFPWDLGDAQLEDLLLRLLEKDPDRRPTVSEIRHHPWLHEPETAPASDDEGPMSPSFTTITVTSDDVSKALRSMLSFRVLPSTTTLDSLEHNVDRHESHPRALVPAGAPKCSVRLSVGFIPRMLPGSGSPRRRELLPKVLVSIAVEPTIARHLTA